MPNRLPESMLNQVKYCTVYMHIAFTLITVYLDSVETESQHESKFCPQSTQSPSYV